LLVLRDHIGQPTRSGEESSDGDVEEMFSPICDFAWYKNGGGLGTS
jgi:hypothetical protein